MRLSELFESAQHHDTVAFTAWFRGSKMRNADGTPMVLYHATVHDFHAFKVGGVDPKVSGHAIWLTTSQNTNNAAHHTGGVKSGWRQGANVMPVYARIERPLVIDTVDMLMWAQAVFANGSTQFPQLLPREWVNEVTRDGEYDGIVFDGPALGWGPDSTEVIVFKANQIKSALGNSGSYGPEDEDVTR